MTDVLIILVVAIVVFFAWEKTHPTGVPNAAPKNSMRPPSPCAKIDPGAAGVAGGTSLLTHNYAGAAVAAYGVLSNPCVDKQIGKAVVAALGAPLDAGRAVIKPIIRYGGAAVNATGGALTSGPKAATSAIASGAKSVLGWL